MQSLIQTSFFDPLIPFIEFMDDQGNIAIRPLVGIRIDLKSVEAYLQGHSVDFIDGFPELITGKIRQKEVADYLFAKRQNTVYFGFTKDI